MKKTLRFFLAVMALMLCGNVMAQKTVTFDFNENVATIFPTITSYSSGTGSTYVADGEFMETTTSTAIEGVTVTVSASAPDAQNRNRLWATNPRLRMYDGTLTITSTSDKITKMEITRTTNNGLVANNNTVDTGALTTSDQVKNGVVEWAGEAQSVTITIAGNTQFSKIVVTIGGEAGTITPDDPNKKGSVNNPYTVTEVKQLLETMDPNVKSDKIYVKGFVTEVSEVETVEYGNATFYINDAKSATDGQFYVFRCMYLENTKFTSTDQLKVDDEVIVCGQVVNYRSSKAAETDPVTPEFTQGCFVYSHNGKTKADNTQPVEEVKQISVAEALAIINDLESGKTTTIAYRVKGFVVGDPEFQRKAEDQSLFGNVNFTMADTQDGSDLLTVFRARYFGNVLFTEETISELKAGDEVIVEGKLQKYVKNEVTTPELTSCFLYSINGNTGNVDPQPGELTGKGTLESPYTAADANIVAGKLAQGETSADSYYIQGKISKITYTFSASFGTATFFISADGTETNQFQCYSVYYLENKSWVDGNTQIALGDNVIIYGQLTNYNGTPETASKKAYIYSLNGKTKNEGGDQPQPEAQSVSVEQALDIINDDLEDGKTTTENYLVSGFVTAIEDLSPKNEENPNGFGNATFTLCDEVDGTIGVKVFRAKGFNNELITTADFIKVGDEVVVFGKLQRYVKNEVMTPEVSSCYIYSVNGNTSNINAVKTVNRTNGTIYNLQGQRVANMQKGLYIVDGKKYLVK